MKKKEISELSTEELKSKMKTLKGIIIIMSILAFLYVVFFIYRIASGKWDTTNTLGTVMLGMLGIVISTTTIQHAKMAKILQNRKER